MKPRKPYFTLSILAFVFAPLAAVCWAGMWLDFDAWPLLCLAAFVGVAGIAAGIAGVTGHRSATTLFVAYAVLLIAVATLDMIGLALRESASTSFEELDRRVALFVHGGAALVSAVWAFVVLGLALGKRRSALVAGCVPS
jgi:hypothetical protein